MIGSDKEEDMIERVTEIYVAVFPMPVSDDRMAEVILAGFKRSGESEYVNCPGDRRDPRESSRQFGRSMR